MVADYRDYRPKHFLESYRLLTYPFTPLKGVTKFHGESYSRIFGLDVILRGIQRVITRGRI